MHLIRSLPLLTLISLSACKSVRTTQDDTLERNRVGGQDLLKEKFAATWKPEDAAWYNPPGEENAKKKKEGESGRKRSQFESVVATSRSRLDEHKSNQWDKRANYEKEWSGKKSKDTFKWPWQKADLSHKESGITKIYNDSTKAAHDGKTEAREATATNLNNDKEYTKTEYDSHKPDIAMKEQWEAAKPENHREMNIIEDRAKPKEDKGWSVSDIRKFLNKR
jgi:hypothetical protein